MASRAACFVVLLGGLAAGGCGTVANLAQPGAGGGGKVPFGGIQHDLYGVQGAHEESAPDSLPGSGPPPRLGKGLVCAVDLPFSLVGDLVTWPYTAAYTFINAPVPVPPFLAAPDVLSPQATTTQDGRGSSSKPQERDAGQAKSKDDKPAELPMPTPEPKGRIP